MFKKMPSFRHLRKREIWRQLCEIAYFAIRRRFLRTISDGAEQTLHGTRFGVLNTSEMSGTRWRVWQSLSISDRNFGQCSSSQAKYWDKNGVHAGYLIQLYAILINVFITAMTEIVDNAQRTQVSTALRTWSCINIRIFQRRSLYFNRTKIMNINRL